MLRDRAVEGIVARVHFPEQFFGIKATQISSRVVEGDCACENSEK
jgi:hypothetical protein